VEDSLKKTSTTVINDRALLFLEKEIIKKERESIPISNIVYDCSLGSSAGGTEPVIRSEASRNEYSAKNI
jgi:hypothetical protein